MLIIEELIVSAITPALFIDIIKNKIANTIYTINNPLITPYKVPPALLHCLIIGKFAIPSAINLRNIKTILITINKPIATPMATTF